MPEFPSACGNLPVLEPRSEASSADVRFLFLRTDTQSFSRAKTLVNVESIVTSPWQSQ